MANNKKDIYDFVEDIIVKTSDVSKELASVAKEYNAKISQIDFDIQKVKTFEIDKSNNSRNELDSGLLKRLNEDDHFIRPTLEIQQFYTIRIFQKDDYDDPFRDCVTHLTANENFTSISLIFEKGSELHYRDTLERDLINLINKKKVLNNILINVREHSIRKEIDQFLKKRIPVLEENYYLKVADGVDSVPQIDDKLSLIYKEEFDKQQRAKGSRVDHSQKGLIIAVAKDDLIIQYIKPQKGVEGRDCRGKLLKIQPPKIQFVPDFKVSENIRVDDNQNSIDYFALKDGNVVFKDGIYDVEDNVQIGALSFKHTGSINAGTERDIEINVKESDSVKDAVGMGVKVTVSTLNVDGNVGEHAEITAHEVKVLGQTHQTSKIYADNAEIGIHKGKLFAEKANIHRLEAGVVEGEIIHIKDAAGGIIRAREVYIETLYSHVKIFSSKKVHIQNIHGSENLIVVDLEGYKDGVNEIEETRKVLQETAQRVEYLQRILKEELDEVLEVRKAFTFATKRLKNYEKNSIEPPQSLIDSLKEHQSFLEHYKEMKEESKIKKEKVELYENKFRELEGAIFDAEIRVEDTWKGYNKVEFRLINPKRVLEKILQNGNREALFQVEKVMYEDDQFDIVCTKLEDLEK
jgi:hypothetical protein